MAQPRRVVGSAFVVALLLAAGSAVALASATGDQGSTRAVPSPAPLDPLPTTAPSPLPSLVPTPTATPTPTPTPTSTPSPSATPSTTATPTPAPTATVTASPTAAPVVTHYAYPKPTHGYTALYLAQVGYDPDGDSTHDAPYLKSHAKDGDGRIRLGRITWGDGTSTDGPGAPAACGPRPSPTTRPGPYQPEPDDRTFANNHTYAQNGDYTITVTVASGNADCRPNGPAPETASLTLTVHIGPPA